MSDERCETRDVCNDLLGLGCNVLTACGKKEDILRA